MSYGNDEMLLVQKADVKHLVSNLVCSSDKDFRLWQFEFLYQYYKEFNPITLSIIGIVPCVNVLYIGRKRFYAKQLTFAPHEPKN